MASAILTLALSCVLARAYENVTIYGSCDGLVDGVYFYVGMVTGTSPQAPYYKTENANGTFWMFWDPRCGGPFGTSTARWIIDEDEPNTTAAMDLDGDGNCVYALRINSVDPVPAGTGTWRGPCPYPTGSWVNQELSIWDGTSTTTTVTSATVTATATTATATTVTATVTTATTVTATATTVTATATTVTATATTVTATVTTTSTVLPLQVLGCLGMLTPAIPLEDMVLAYRKAVAKMAGDEVVESMVQVSITFGAACDAAARRLQDANSTAAQEVAVSFVITFPGHNREAENTTAAILQNFSVAEVSSFLDQEMQQITSLAGTQVEITSRIHPGAATVLATSTTEPVDAASESGADGGRVIAAIVGGLVILACIVLVAKKLWNRGAKAPANAETAADEEKPSDSHAASDLAVAGKGETPAYVPHDLLDQRGAGETQV